eukprot:TRINITY_DN717_c0_g1_i2.p1 TRINITY_DN717_c0_g1~~TRINITY_DN717_c0_g1_i2.p1  ORF type:complete len:347 (+),score=117.81 TRINITY_DN717_c0_g1_i2:49-1089(+)
MITKLSLVLAFTVLSVAAATFPLKGCPPLSPRPTPTNVNDLHVQDVKVVMALGDSISAGFGIVGQDEENRGMAFSMGGDDGFVTLPNLFKYYNPQLQGFAVGNHSLERANAPHAYPDQDRLNGAQSGALVQDLSAQLDYVLGVMKNNSQINIAEDWKVMTIWIGANNLCGVCTDPPSNTADVYEQNMDQLLAKIHQEIPRVFVNILPTMNLSQVLPLGKNSTWCDLFHTFSSECNCLFHGTDSDRANMDALGQEYAVRLQKLSNKYTAMKIPDFAVVYQPFLRDTVIPDSSYISTLDCFHPSERAHVEVATYLWNSMLTAVPYKPTAMEPGHSPICPTDETSLLWT